MRIHTPLQKLRVSRFGSRTFHAALFLSLLSSGPLQTEADQVPNPTVTASARPYNANFSATNLFDNANAEFASLTQGAVSVPFTREATDGTWVELDFGSTVEFDRFVMRSRANAVDVVGESRLIVSDDETFDETDEIFTFNPSGSNGAGIIQNLYRTVSGRYARWEVTSRTGTGLNLGANQMWFLKTPEGQTLLPPPTVIFAFTPFNAGYAEAFAVNGDYGSEYASLGGAELTGIDFDFGAPREISGFEFLNRFADRITAFDMVFANTPDFVEPIATMSFTADPNGNWVNTETFEAVTAQYVRLQATAFEGAPNTGVREIQFFTTANPAPVITTSPVGGTRLTGDRFVFRSAVLGSNPVTFQWIRNGTDIQDATNATLLLPSLTVDDAGTYRIEATTPNGSVTSESAELVVLDPALDIESDLRLHLKFDESTGDIASDASGNSRDGTLFGSLGDDSQWVEGRVDGGIRMNIEGNLGDDTVLVMDDGGLDFSTSPEFTLAAWINGAAVQENGAGIIAKGPGQGGEQFALDVDAGVYRFYVRNEAGAASVFPTSARPNDTWQHLAIVFSAPLNRMKVYLNGAEIRSGTPPATLLQNVADVSIGSRQAGPGDFDLNFNGTIDDVRIYGRALTDRDVTELFNLASLIGPTIVTQPVGGTFLALDNINLAVLADGSAPLRYQWNKGTQAILNATNATLTLTNATSADDGTYFVTISNAVGEVTSDSVVVAVNDPAPALENGLALHYKLDETTGVDVADSSGNNRSGYLQDFPENPWVAGTIDGALAFNPEGAADNDTLIVNEDGGLEFSTTREFSLAAWVKGAATQEPGAPIIARGTGAGGEQYALDTFNGLRFYVRNEGAVASVYGTAIPFNDTWQHVAAVFSEPMNRVKLYLNGVEIASGTPPPTLQWTDYPTTIGSRQAGAGAYDLNFAGLIDDVRIYNRALTPREVRELGAVAAPPEITVTRSGNDLTISWPAGDSLILVSSDVLPSENWTPVAGVENNSITITPAAGNKFYRLQAE